MSTDTIVIHVGMPKTGTTLLQRRLFPRHPQLYYFGKLARYTLSENLRGDFPDPDAAEIVHGVKFITDDAFEARRRELRERAIAMLRRRGGRTGLLSVEGFTSSLKSPFEEQARRLRVIFGEARILLTLRHPVEFLESYFLKDIKHLSDEGPGWRGGALRMKYHNWLAAQRRSQEEGVIGRYEFLDYLKRARIYSDLFGADRVKILLYEQLRSDPDAFTEKMCGFLGIDSDKARSLIDGKRENTRRGPATLGPLPDPDAQIVAARSAEYRRLAQDFELPLAEHGYC